jgi:hypothetical protein
MVPIDNRAKQKKRIINNNEINLIDNLQYLYFVDLVHHQVILDQLEYLIQMSFIFINHKKKFLQYVLAIQQ